MTLDETIERYTRNAEYERTHGNLQGYLEFKQLAEWLKDYKRLLEQQSREDCISRQAVLDESFEVDTKEYGRIEVVGVDAIESLPPITPQQKYGKWQRYDGLSKLSTEDIVICDQCAFVTYKDSYYKYCPSCGAKMQEREEV